PQRLVRRARRSEVHRRPDRQSHHRSHRNQLARRQPHHRGLPVTIPDYQTLMRPVLEYLADGGEHRLRDLKEAMADQFNLTAEERAQMTPSGRSRLIYNRVGWATSYLAQAGLIHRPRRGYSVITAEGRRVLAEHPDRVD